MPIPLTEQVFRIKADEALEALERSLLPLADDEGFDLELQGSVLNITFESPAPARFVISPNGPVRQIWVSALVKGYKLDWAPERGVFALGDESLEALVTGLIHRHLGH